MQPALAGVIALPPPASRALIFTRLHRARAGRASDAWKAAVVQGVVGQPLLADVFPYLVFRPFQQGTHLVQAVLAVPFHRRCQRAAGRLPAPDSGDPGAAARDRAPKRFHLANAATSAALLETGAKPIDAVLTHPALQSRSIGVIDGQGTAVALLQSLDEIIGFRIQAPGIDAEYIDLRHGPPNEVGENDGFGP